MNDKFQKSHKLTSDQANTAEAYNEMDLKSNIDSKKISNTTENNKKSFNGLNVK